MSVSASEVYKEIGENYRHHLHWREKLFAGFLAVLAALAVAFHHTYNDKDGWNRFAWMVPSVGFFLALVFLAADYRCAQVIRLMRIRGKELEAPLKGGYTIAVKDLDPKTFFEHLTTHTWVLRLLYMLTAIFLFTVAIILFVATGGDERGVMGGEAMSELNQMAIVFAIYNLSIALIGLAVIYLGYKLLCRLYACEDTRKKVVSDGWGSFFRVGALSILFVGLGVFIIIASLRGCIGIDLSDTLHKSFPAVTSSQQPKPPSKATP